jgi:tRNA G18 (ribose-2'-O)-methylase SpoU
MRKLSWDEIDRPDPDAVADLPKHPVRLVLHNVRSIYNVGSIFRTSDAARIDHIHLTGYTGTPDHPDMHKTALGAQDVVAWSHHETAEEVVGDLAERGYTIGALEITDAPTPPSEVQAAHFPLCLIVGNEVHGVEDSLISRADVAFELPQYGAKQSINVAVAYGIAIYEIVHQYRQMNGPPT